MKNQFRRFFREILGRLSREAGMTLVETLVAIAILGVTSSTFILALSTGTIATGVQEENALASGLAQAQMETIKQAAYDATGASYTPISSPSGYTISIGSNSSLYGNSNIQKVTVTVSRGGNTVITLEGYKVNR